MQYLALIYDSEAERANVPADLMEQYGAYTKDIIAAGVFKAGDALQPTGTATSIRVRNGKTQLTDGPFAETKEQLGGYYLLECDSLDDAIAWAAKIPSAKFGTVEVRPVVVWDD